MIKGKISVLDRSEVQFKNEEKKNYSHGCYT